MNLKKLLISLILLLTFSFPVYASSPVLDGSVVTNTNASSNTISASGFSATAGSIVFLHVGGVFVAPTAAPQVQSISITGSSPTWTLLDRTTVADTAGGGTCSFSTCNIDTEIFYTANVGTISSQTVTATFQGGATPTAVIAVFAIKNLFNSASPFDTNLSLPAKATSTSESINNVGGISTTEQP